MSENIEREVKFLNIDVPALKTKLNELGAEDKGEHLLREVIFYHGDFARSDDKLARRYVRIRTAGNKIYLTYKSWPAVPTIGTEEIELEVSDAKNTEALLIALGWHVVRRQEKRRHTFKIGETYIEIDTWPGGVPPYIEIEGPSEEAIIKTAEDLGLSWDDKLMLSAARVLRQYYGINVWDLTKFSFDEIK